MDTWLYVLNAVVDDNVVINQASTAFCAGVALRNVILVLAGKIYDMKSFEIL